MIKTVTIYSLCILILVSVLPSMVSAQDDVIQAPSDHFVEKTPAVEAEDPEAQKPKNVNVDMQLTYGQYNNMFSTITLSHEQDDFVYLLTSNFKRSNDYGYNGETFFNTSFYENKIGFTGNLTVTDSWKTMFECAVNNDSHGMYDNDVYSREEKDKYSLSAKSTVRQSSSFEWYSALNYSGYTHRLAGRLDENNEKSSLNKIRGELGGEIVWSGTNRIKGHVLASYYDYSEKYTCNDYYIKGEISDDFKLTTNVGVSIGMQQCWNRDSGLLGMGHLPESGKITSLSEYPYPLNPFILLSFTGAKYISASVSYKYDMENFRPENYYFEQKYVLPQYRLPPARQHLGDAKLDIRISDILTVKSSANLKKTDNLYNYYTLAEGNVLAASFLPAVCLTAKTDWLLSIPSTYFQISSGYEYAYFRADENITYHPAHTASFGVKYGAKQWNFEWSNKFTSAVYIDPHKDAQIPRSIVGLFGIQLQMISGLYSYLRIENLYNRKYYLRDGYPESGVSVLGGLRILI